jgi:hypothetical protein
VKINAKIALSSRVRLAGLGKMPEEEGMTGRLQQPGRLVNTK